MAAPDLTKLGKYDIVRILGRGAMGTVYEGFDPIIARRVAIKTVNLDDTDDAEAAEGLLRFRREAQAAGRLTHPNIVGIYDYGETDGLAYIVMEYVEGETLKSVLDRGERFATVDALRMMRSLLAGLAYSHDNGVIHRDIKPANVMITRDDQVKLADFGVARIESSSLTQAGTMIGTPSYMSPEQFMGQTIDMRTDIYSAGVMLYQLLTGEKPFEGSITAIMHKVLNVEPPAPSALSISVPPRLDAIVRKAMAKRPDDRFADAREFAQALATAESDTGSGSLSLAGEGVDGDATMIASSGRHAAAAPEASVRLPTPPAPTGETGGRRGLLIGGIAAAALIVAGGGTYFLLGGGHHAAQQAAPSHPSATKPASARSVKTPAPAPAPPVAAQATPAPASAPTPVPPPSAATIEARLTAAVRQTSCAMATGSARNGDFQVSALVRAANKPALAAAIDDVARAIPSAHVAVTLDDFTGPYCGMVSTIEPYAPVFADAAQRLGFRLAGGVNRLAKGQPITVRVKPPAWAHDLEIDYVSSNGQIYRLHPAADRKDGIISDTLGQVGAPFGRDMIVAIASTAPLPLATGDQLTSTKAWPGQLQSALSTITQKGGRVATAAILLDTRPK
ncbi:serine/threonine-protein kinase [Acidiphilium sp.]|uniref:serine/threonine-protein kinase n=1 Tax=Acidiphilium sp. TaxID=527 RepID=UPI002590DB21|nr:serine/threonine-protein kinase [Acidiphilium sp.]